MARLRWLILFSAAACGRGAPAAPLASTVNGPLVASAANAPPPVRERPADDAGPGPGEPRLRAIALPGAVGPVTIDYIVYEPGRARVWVPVGETGSVDVLDVAKGTFARIDGFKTREVETHGRKRTMGPSAAAVADGFVYVGNRASSEVCPVDANTLAAGDCLKLSSPTDGVAYVGSTKEVWVTTPRDHAIAVLDASEPGTLKAKTTVQLEGAPEGYAVDDGRALFFTNLEDKNQTLVIDAKTHSVTQRCPSGCGPDGPRGIAADRGRGFVYVACMDHVEVKGGGHGGHGGVCGESLARLDTGAGVDNIDWVESQRILFVAAAKAAKLTVARIDDQGRPTLLATWTTAPGARNAVADASGRSFLPDPVAAQMLIFSPPVL